jgi:hypothetical protein
MTHLLAARLWMSTATHLEQGECLKSGLIRLYMEETARHIRLFEKLRIKKTKLLTSLTFLLHCRDHDTIPRFLQIHHHIHSRASNRINQRTSFALLRERIHHKRRELDNISRTVENTPVFRKPALQVGLVPDRPNSRLRKLHEWRKTAKPDNIVNSYGSTRHNSQLQRPRKKRQSTWVARRWMMQYIRC